MHFYFCLVDIAIAKLLLLLHKQQNQNSVAFLTDFWLVQVSNMVDIVSCFEKEPAVVARWHVGEERTFSCIPQLNYTVVGPQKEKYDALCFHSLIMLSFINYSIHLVYF